MADRLSVKLVGTRLLEKRLKELSPAQNRDIVEPALLESMLLSLRIAAREKIHPGGKGPPRAGKLTSRTGSLRRSLGFGKDANALDAVDQRGLRRNFVEGGSDLVYARVHEEGIGVHPPRPFLAPGLEDATRQFESIFVKHWRTAADL